MTKAKREAQSLKDLAQALAAAATARHAEKQQQELKKAEALKARLEVRRDRARQRCTEITEQRDRLRRKNRSGSTQSKTTLDKLDKSWALTRTRLRDIDHELREARALLRESRSLFRAAERKQRALTQALLAFLKKWEKEYNKKHALEIQNTRVRRGWLNND